jgi:hypothetical protein
MHTARVKLYGSTGLALRDHSSAAINEQNLNRNGLDHLKNNQPVDVLGSLVTNH